MGLGFLPVAVATIAGAQAGTQVLTHLSARIVAVPGLALAAAGYAVAAGWPQPAVTVTGLSIAALGIGATFVSAFTASHVPARISAPPPSSRHQEQKGIRSGPTSMGFVMALAARSCALCGSA